MRVDKKLVLNILGRVAFIMVAVYVVTGVILFFNKTSYIYFPDHTDFSNCPYFKADEKISYNGTRFYYRENGQSLVILYHGNAGRACDRTLYASYFDSNSISYILAEYAGYAGDKNDPSREIILSDVKNIIDFTQGLNMKEFTILGESIGAGVALEHVRLEEPDKLILISPFSKLSDVARIHYPFYPTRFLGREDYDNLESLAQYKGELLIIHGEDDEIVPSSMTEKLYEISDQASQRDFLIIPKAEHNDLLVHNKVFEKIIEFVTSSLDNNS
jgi:uncharacterized protein